MSVDPLSLTDRAPSVLGDPQSWNAYAYVRNNPLNLTDPTGMIWCSIDYKSCISDKSYEWCKKHCIDPVAWQQYTHHIPDQLLRDLGLTPAQFMLIAAAVRGHHGLPRQWFKELPKGPVRDFFEKWTTGELEGRHVYDKAHRAYNKIFNTFEELATPEGRERLAREGLSAARKLGQKIAAFRRGYWGLPRRHDYALWYDWTRSPADGVRTGRRRSSGGAGGRSHRRGCRGSCRNGRRGRIDRASATVGTLGRESPSFG